MKSTQASRKTKLKTKLTTNYRRKKCAKAESKKKLFNKQTKNEL